MDTNTIANIVVAITAIVGVYTTYKVLSKERQKEKDERLEWRLNIENQIENIEFDIRKSEETNIEQSENIRLLSDSLIELRQHNAIVTDMKLTMRELAITLNKLSESIAVNSIEIVNLKDIVKHKVDKQ